MKFLLMIVGMNSATADYACLSWKMFKEERWHNTSKPSDYYKKEPLKGHWKKSKDSATVAKTTMATLMNHSYTYRSPM